MVCLSFPGVTIDVVQLLASLSSEDLADVMDKAATVRSDAKSLVLSKWSSVAMHKQTANFESENRFVTPAPAVVSENRAGTPSPLGQPSPMGPSQDTSDHKSQVMAIEAVIEKPTAATVLNRDQVKRTGAQNEVKAQSQASVPQGRYVGPPTAATAALPVDKKPFKGSAEVQPKQSMREEPLMMEALGRPAVLGPSVTSTKAQGSPASLGGPSQLHQRQAIPTQSIPAQSNPTQQQQHPNSSLPKPVQLNPTQRSGTTPQSVQANPTNATQPNTIITRQAQSPHPNTSSQRLPSQPSQPSPNFIQSSSTQPNFTHAAVAAQQNLTQPNATQPSSTTEGGDEGKLALLLKMRAMDRAADYGLSRNIWDDTRVLREEDRGIRDQNKLAVETGFGANQLSREQSLTLDDARQRSAGSFEIAIDAGWIGGSAQASVHGGEEGMLASALRATREGSVFGKDEGGYMISPKQ